MMQRRLFSLIGSLILLGIGLSIGITIQQLWRVPEALAAAVATPASAAFGKKAESAPRISGAAKAPTPVTQVVNAVSPSVVTVGAIKRRVVAQPWMHDYFLQPSIRYRQYKERIPYMGSGFLVDESGHVVTNFHVIEDSEALFVTFPDGREFPARLVDADRYIDVALLEIDPKGEKLPPPLAFAESSELQIGEEVVAFGNPFGNLMEDARPTITVGFISALSRTFRPDQQNARVYQDMIQTDAAINPGNSGGPLVDINGDVAGVNTFIFSPSGASAGIGFAIPANRVRAFVEEVKKYGRIRDLRMDFAFRTVRTNNGTAVQILGMEPDGPAEKAGITPGDILVKVDGRRVATSEDFRLLFASKQVGDRVLMDVVSEKNEKPRQISYEVLEAAK